MGRPMCEDQWDYTVQPIGVVEDDFVADGIVVPRLGQQIFWDACAWAWAAEDSESEQPLLTFDDTLDPTMHLPVLRANEVCESGSDSGLPVVVPPDVRGLP